MKQRINLSNIFTQPNIYTGIYLLYSIRHILFGESSFVGRILFLAFYLLSIYYLLKTILTFKLPNSLKALNLCLVLIIIYGSLLFLFGIDSSWRRSTTREYYLLIHLESIAPIFVFYFFSKKGLVNEQWFRTAAIFFFITVLVQYNYYATQYMNYDDKAEELVNNNAYLWLALFPIMTFFEKKPVIKYVGLLVILFYLISGFKRGAILLGGVCFLVFLWQSVRASKGSRKYITIVIAGVLLVVAVNYIEALLLNSSLFAHRVEQTMAGESSQRDVIYSTYWSFFWDQNSLLGFVFGHGAFGTLKHLGLMAHNDWLEILIDMGFVGTVVYFIYWISNIIMCRRSARVCSHEAFLGILFFVIIYLGRSFFSMSIMDMSFYATSVFGYYVAQYDNSLRNSLTE